MSYAERLTVPLRWWAQATMLLASLWLAFVVALPAAAAWTIAAIAAALVAGCLLWYGGARITITDGELRAGRAHIPTRLVGGADPLDAEATRRIAGVEADARAYLLLRPYLKRAVKVEIADPADPTPYWLLSTRHPDRLANALATTAPEAGAAG
ncbi:DUF3093 domain-containing protein [Nocardioides speluncae]|uniref:DUF3093 domain-containing protein n=1 Tax=Nocardioides speluncae TaxID=2670337 RepID=UPI000D69AB09|nr:DUF3093 domain-containing protein [Nocardioides speluncae]